MRVLNVYLQDLEPSVLTKVKYMILNRLVNMNKPTLMALAAMAALAVAVSTPIAANAQYFGGGGEALTQEQLDYCEQYSINPCTQNNILAKERLLAAQANPSTGSGTPMLSTESGTLTLFVAVLGAIFGGVAAAFFFAGRRGKQATG